MPFDSVCGLVVVHEPNYQYDATTLYIPVPDATPLYIPVPLTKVHIDTRIVNFIAQVSKT